MKKHKIVLSIILVFFCIISGCAQSQPNDSKTEIYTIPNSYFEFTGSEIDEAVESCLELGDDFCTAAKVTPDGLQLELTDEQLNNLVQRNDNFIDELVNQFTSSNNMYKCVLDDSYKKLTLYFDENLSSAIQTKTILGIASVYGMNYMLLNNTTEWNVQIDIVNCHTNRPVVSVNIPNEEISYGAKEWEESYNDKTPIVKAVEGN